MKSLSEKDFKRINISKNYETLTTKKDYIKKQQRQKNINYNIICFFFDNIYDSNNKNIKNNFNK